MLNTIEMGLKYYGLICYYEIWTFQKLEWREQREWAFSMN